MKHITALLLFVLFILSLGGCYIYTKEPPPAAIIIAPSGPPPPPPPPPSPPPAGEVGPAR